MLALIKMMTSEEVRQMIEKLNNMEPQEGTEYREVTISKYNDNSSDFFMEDISPTDLEVGSWNWWGVLLVVAGIYLIVLPFLIVLIDAYKDAKASDVTEYQLNKQLRSVIGSDLWKKNISFSKLRPIDRFYATCFIALQKFEEDRNQLHTIYGIAPSFAAFMLYRAANQKNHIGWIFKWCFTFWFGNSFDFYSSIKHLGRVLCMIGIVLVYTYIAFAFINILVVVPQGTAFDGVESVLQPGAMGHKVENSGVVAIKNLLYGSMFIFTLFGVMALLFALIGVVIVVRKIRKK